MLAERWDQEMRDVKWLMSLLLLVCSVSVKAQNTIDVLQSDSLLVQHTKIYFPINKSNIVEDYMDNSERLANIKRIFSELPRIDSVTIYSYASPDGRYEFNKKLAIERGNTVKRYLLDNISRERSLLDSLIHISPTPENWASMRDEIIENYTLADKAEVLEILDRKDISDTKREQLLRTLNGGRSWQFIAKNILPQLRYATWISVWLPVVEPLIPVDAALMPIDMPVERPMLAESARELYSVPVVDDRYKTTVALKTNMLYDAASLLNYSVEVPFEGNKYSGLIYHQFPWWRWGENKHEYCVRFLGLGLEGRWWFKPSTKAVGELGRESLVGHFVGLYGESGMYDFQWKRSICYQGEYWSAGVSYGYSMPISKRFNLEFSISGGYASINFRGYTPAPDYSMLWRDYDRQGRWHYLGVTKAQVSLVMPIYIKSRKGGR